jgi:uncharacterized protein (DUF433 family)
MTLPLDPQTVPLTPVEGGVYRVTGTRIPLDTIVHSFNRGESAEGIVDAYPTLALRDVYAIIGYYLANRAAVDAYVAEQDARADEIKRDITSRPDYQQWRERLLARKAQLDARQVSAK